MQDLLCASLAHLQPCLEPTPIPHFLLHQERVLGNWEGALLPIWCEAHIPLQYPGVACLRTPGWNNNEWEARLHPPLSSKDALLTEASSAELALPPCLSLQASPSLTPARLLVRRRNWEQYLRKWNLISYAHMLSG